MSPTCSIAMYGAHRAPMYHAPQVPLRQPEALDENGSKANAEVLSNGAL